MLKKRSPLAEQRERSPLDIYEFDYRHYWQKRLSLKHDLSIFLRNLMSVVIPDDILQSTEMSEDELRLEIAIMLYKQEKISSGKARAWTGLTVIEFQHELAKRGYCINYDVEDLQADISTLQSMELL